MKFVSKLKHYANHKQKVENMDDGTFTLTEEQQKILDCCDNQLIIGGPGSGKTTISILKAGKWVGKIKKYQNVLFLSFARATVSRVFEAIDEQSLLSNETKKRIHVDTYHAFFWKILKTHGYLLGLPRKISILTPPNESILLSSIRDTYGKEKELDVDEKVEKKQKELEAIKKRAFEKGEIAFDLFAKLAFSLLYRNNKILDLIANSFPVVIFDEFQDTNSDQWEVIKCLKNKCIVITLADPEQRIFDFIGADPLRINHFIDFFKPSEFDLKDINHRSVGTDIKKFGDDILSSKFQDYYPGIEVFKFPSNKNQAFHFLKIETIKARKRLIKRGEKNWTIAVLVPTKKMVREVSNSFSQKTKTTPVIYHNAVIDMFGAILAAEVIAYMLQPRHGANDFDEFIQLVCNFFYGKGGDSITKTDIREANSIIKAFDKYKDKIAANEAIPKGSVLNGIIEGYHNCSKLSLSGNPLEDWLSVTNTLESSKCKRLKSLAEEAKNLNLLKRGSELREALTRSWRNNGCYVDALDNVRQAFIIEYFSTSQNPEKGIIVMNMHKAKGKQFDEVIIFEGWPKKANGKIVGNPDRIVNYNMKLNDDDLMKYKFNLRVSVTRAKLKTTLMTPGDDPCVLLL